MKYSSFISYVHHFYSSMTKYTTEDRTDLDMYYREMYVPVGKDRNYSRDVKRTMGYMLNTTRYSQLIDFDMEYSFNGKYIKLSFLFQYTSENELN